MVALYSAVCADALAEDIKAPNVPTRSLTVFLPEMFGQVPAV